MASACKGRKCSNPHQRERSFSTRRSVAVPSDAGGCIGGGVSDERVGPGTGEPAEAGGTGHTIPDLIKEDFFDRQSSGGQPF